MELHVLFSGKHTHCWLIDWAAAFLIRKQTHLGKARRYYFFISLPSPPNANIILPRYFI